MEANEMIHGKVYYLKSSNEISSWIFKFDKIEDRIIYDLCSYSFYLKGIDSASSKLIGFDKIVDLRLATAEEALLLEIELTNEYEIY